MENSFEMVWTSVRRSTSWSFRPLRSPSSMNRLRLHSHFQLQIILWSYPIINAFLPLPKVISTMSGSLALRFSRLTVSCLKKRARTVFRSPRYRCSIWKLTHQNSKINDIWFFFQSKVLPSLLLWYNSSSAATLYSSNKNLISGTNLTLDCRLLCITFNAIYLSSITVYIQINDRILPLSWRTSHQ